MSLPANAAVRERRRKSSPRQLARINVIQALTAAEYSRRQFILNFAASRHFELLLPGRKADAVKAAEEWVSASFAKEGYHHVDAEFYKYTVDSQLWSTYVGDEVDFPFSFMQERADISIDTKRKSEAFSTTEEIDVRDGEIFDLTKSSTSSSRRSQASPSPTQQTTRQRSSKNRESIIPESFQRRSQTFNTIEYGEAPKPKGSLLKRLSRTWSRRKSTET
ncbi:hypothetical protein N0V88_007523 [Collariella sp. IMI 366227]|nr:hypothetical protein N0V88_007523 [Collariella sp. IMI 366227]